MSLLDRLFCRSSHRRGGRRRGVGWAAAESLERRLAFDVDLAVTVADGISTYRPGGESVQTVIVTNVGPTAVTGARVVAPLPVGVTSATWVAEVGLGASAVPVSGVSGGGDALLAVVDIPAGQAVMFSVTNQIAGDATGPLVFEVETRAPIGESDSDPTNNTASDTNYRPLVVAGSDIDARSTPTVTVVDPVSGAVVSQFLAFPPSFRGGVRTAFGDVDGDGVDEVIAAPGPGFVGEVRVFELDGIELPQFRLRPFGNRFVAGLNIAFGDFDGDGRGDLAVGQSRGGQVGLHRGLVGGGWEAAAFRSFSPFGSGHVSGVTLAGGDLESVTAGVVTATDVPDGRSELIVGTGPGGRQPVRLFDLSSSPALIGEVPVDPSFGFGGVTVSAGLFDDDGISDLFISGGRGVSGVTDVYSGRLEGVPSERLERFGRPAEAAGGNAPASATPLDIDGDGRTDRILSLSGIGGSGGTPVLDRTGVSTGTLTVLRGPLQPAAPTAIPFDTTLITTASGLQYRDLAVGSGSVVAVGQNVRVNYVGRRLNGELFDNSYGRGDPFAFDLGTRQVIAGWDEGIAGMRVGGRRRLIIPPDLGYGDSPPPGNIQPGDTLVFDVELVGASNPVLTR